MPTTLLNPKKYKKFPYATTRGWRKLGIEVEASIPIDVYIVQDSDLQNWRIGKSYGGVSFLAWKKIDAQINIPKDFEQEWYLVLENTGREIAAVHYELFDL